MIQVSGSTGSSSCCHWDGNLAATSCKCPWQGRSYLCPSLRTAASRRALPTMPALCASQRCFLRIPFFFFLSSLPFWMLDDKRQSSKNLPTAQSQGTRTPKPSHLPGCQQASRVNSWVGLSGIKLCLSSGDLPLLLH